MYINEFSQSVQHQDPYLKVSTSSPASSTSSQGIKTPSDKSEPLVAFYALTMQQGQEQLHHQYQSQNHYHEQHQALVIQEHHPQHQPQHPHHQNQNQDYGSRSNFIPYNLSSVGSELGQVAYGMPRDDVSSSSFDELRCQTPSHSLSGSLHRAERSSAMDRRDDNDDIKSMEKRAKRREQNRNAQRRFRGRQEEYTMKLELEVARLKKIIAEHEATHQNMEELVRKLLAQKDELQRNLDRSFSGTNPSLPSDNRVLTSPNPIQNCASMKDGHQGFDHTSKHVKPGGSSFHVGFRQRSTSNASNQAQAKLRTGEAGPHMNHIESFDPQRLRGQSQQDLQQRSSLMSRPHSSGSENQRGLRPHPQDGLDGYSFPSDNSTVVLGFQSYNMMPSVGINQSTGETLGRSASNPTIQSSGMTGSAELARFPVNRSQPSNMPVVQQPGLAKVFLGEGSNRYGIPTDSLASHTSESYHTSPST